MASKGQLLGWFIAVGVSASAWADWRLSTPGDPSRNWSVQIESGLGYDDNTDTASKKKDSSASINLEPQVQLRWPGQQTSARLQYIYRLLQYTNRDNADQQQSHIVDLSVSHAFTPRLSVTVYDTFRRGIEPELVENSIVTRQRGDFNFNNVGGSVGYQFSPRWSAGLSPNWEILEYDETAIATNDNRQTFGVNAYANYAVTPRLFVGGNYRYSFTEYTAGSSTNESRDVDSQALFATVIYRYKPQVALQLSAGAQLAGFADESSDLSPYVSLTGSYNVGAKTTASAGFTYSIALTEVAQYRSSDQASWFVNLRHQITTKFSTSVDALYVMSTLNNLNPDFKSPFPGITPPTRSESVIRFGCNLRYDFTRWASLSLNYNHDQADSEIKGRSYDRNRYSLNLRLIY